MAWNSPSGPISPRDEQARRRRIADARRARALKFDAPRPLEPRLMPTGNIFVVTNTSANIATSGSLAFAIEDVNSDSSDSAANPDEIEFSIPGGAGVHQIIHITSGLAVSEPVLIDGTTQPGYAGSPLIDIAGDQLPANTTGLAITASSSVVQGISLKKMPGDALVVTGANDLIQSNYVGIDDTGTGPNTAANGSIGIAVAGSHDTIGGTTASARNVIANDGTYGVYLGSATNAVEGNDIGTDASGTVAVPNGLDGIYDSSGGNVIGPGNLISGNTDQGIELEIASSDRIVGNTIGLDAAGAALANGEHGIYVSQSNNVTIGGTTAADRNVISGNGGDGIQLDTGNNDLVEGNYIGTDPGGTVARPDVNAGVELIQAGNATIGGSVAGAGNVISGSTGAGISDGSGGTTIQGNRIGTNAAGAVAVANATGIEVNAAVGDTIGGPTAAAGNVISGNSLYGIELDSSGNLVAADDIGTNLGATGAIPNASFGIYDDAGQNTIGGVTPNVISGNTEDGVQLRSASGDLIAGNLVGLTGAGTAALPNGAIGVDVINSSNVLIGGTTAVARNVIAGNGSVAIQLSSGSDNDLIDGDYVGTNLAGTAPFSGGIVLDASSGNTIGGTGDVIEGGVTLQTASDNNLIVGDRIGLNAAGTAALAGTGTGVQIGTGSAGNTVGGTTVPARNYIGGSTSGNAFGVFITDSGTNNNLVEGNWIGLGVGGVPVPDRTGVYLGNFAASNTIGGVTATAGQGAGNVIGNSTADGVEVNTSGTGTVVEGNLIGTNPAGTAAAANNLGVEVVAGTSTIGGTVAGAGNVISGNATQGVKVEANLIVVAGDRIGTDISGSVALPNAGGGVLVAAGAAYDTIGGTVAAAGDLISGNGGYGIDEVGAGGYIEGDIIGLNAAGTADLYNASGLVITGYFNMIGGGSAGQRNVISGNEGYQIQISTGGGSNFVYGNYLGLNAAGNAAVYPPNGTTSGATVEIDGGAYNNSVGGSGSDASAATRNYIISYGYGVNISGGGTTGNQVSDDYLGVDTAGADGYGGGGVAIQNGASGNVIGVNENGSGSALEANLFADGVSNGVNQIYIDGAGTDDNVVAGNTIGLDTSGNATNFGEPGILIDGGASDNTIGTNADGFGDALERNVISGNYNGIEINGQNAPNGYSTTGNVVAGNYIGTDATGLLRRGNGVQNNDFGVEIFGAPGNTIGGTAAASSNVISGDTSGILIEFAAATANVVEGNLIGLDETGEAVIPGAGSGISLLNGAGNNVIGAPGASNIISGWAEGGIVIYGAGTSGNVVQDDYIGTDRTGLVALGNTGAGILIEGGAAGNTVGGATSAGRDVIVANSTAGVEITGPGSSNNVVEADYIGLDAAGVGGGAYANGMGVYVTNLASGNTIGGVATPAGRAPGNIISGNTYAGIAVDAGSASTAILGNLIGTGTDGVTPLPDGSGISIGGSGAPVAATVVGGTAPGAANIIDDNTGDGVQVLGGTGAAIRGNSIYGNGVLGIELGTGGVPSANILGGSATGPNLRENDPILTTAISSAGQPTVITGDINSAPGRTIFVDFYTDAAEGLGGYGQGQTYVGSTTVVTSISGNAAFTISIPGLARNAIVSATATDATSGTSEFSLDVAEDNPPTSVLVARPSAHGAPATAFNVGQAITLDATGSASPDADALTYTWDFGDGSALGTGATPTHAYHYDGTYVVTLTVNDGHGGIETNIEALTIRPVAPTIALNPLPPMAAVGSVVPVSGTIHDPANDLETVVLTWGDGSPATTIHLAAGATTFATTHAYASPLASGATATITATVTDATNPAATPPEAPLVPFTTPPSFDVGGLSGSTSATLAVSAAAPTITGLTLSSPSIFEGNGVTLSGSFTDPNPLSQHTVTISWGDVAGSSTTIALGIGAVTFSAPHIYLNHPAGVASGSYPITVTVANTNAANLTATASTAVTVADVPPTVAIQALPAASTGSTVSFTSVVGNVGPLARLAYAWTATSAGSVVATGNGQTFAFTEPSGGDYTVVVTVTDEVGASGSAVTTVLVGPSTPSNTIYLNSAGAGLATVTANSATSAPFAVNGPLTFIARGQTDYVQVQPGLTSPVELVGATGGTDTLVAGSGNDTLVSVKGVDTLQGTTGNTDFVLILGGVDPVLDASTGVNTIDLSQTPQDITLDLGSTAAQRVDGGGDVIQLSPGKGSFASLIAGPGNDTITAAGGVNSTIVAGTGADLIYGGSTGTDSIIGGVGNDTIVGRGSSDIIYSGSTGTDSIVGGVGNDTIIGQGSNDIIYSGSTGTDSIVGGTGNDTIIGMGSNDIIYAGSTGTDSIIGGVGNDTIVGTGSNDIIYLGSTGTDSVVGGSGNDTIVGQGSNDIIYAGSTGTDSIVGGTGNDTIVGTGSNDIIYLGSTGTDSVVGGTGNDTIVGMGSNDIIYAGSTGTDSIIGGTGNDTIVGTGSNDIIYLGSTGTDSVIGGTGNDTIVGQGSNDIIYLGSTGTDSVIGGTGNDTIVGMGSNDIIYAGSTGTDSIIGGNGNDTIVGTGSNDIIYLGSTGTDSVVGGVGNDTIVGQGSNDIIYAGSTGTDSIIGGNGNDTIVGTGSNDIIYLGSTGTDSVVGGVGNDTIVGQGSNDIIYAGSTGTDSIIGGNGNDTIVGTGSNDIIYLGSTGTDSVVGGVGNDTIVGQGSNDIIYAGSTGTDSIVGGSGNDTIVATGSNDIIYAGATATDSIVGGSGNDTIVGGSGGSDIIYGGSGDDSIVGGAGDNTISGGGGNDTFVGSAADWLAETAPAGSTNGTPTTVTLTATGLIMPGYGAETISGFRNVIVGLGSGSFLLDATRDSAPLILIGGTGNDTILAGPGDDYLYDGSGSDSLVGGGGNDTFVFGPDAGGRATVVDGSNTRNTLDFSAFAAGVNLDLRAAGPQAVSPGLLSLTLTNPSSIDQVVGSSFPDRILGNGLDDTLIGAGGDDDLDARGGSALIEGDDTRTVFLDFGAGDVDYSAQATRDAIQARLGAIYSAFNFTFTQARPAAGVYTELDFNIPAGSFLGGEATSIDWRALSLGGSASVDIGQFLGGANEPADTPANVIDMTATIAAHELGHLSGLRHGDSFGPIGEGVYANLVSNPNIDGFYPTYYGPDAASDTKYHILASPDSVGASLYDAAGVTFFGEREDVKLAFDDSGTTVSETPGANVTAPTAMPLSLAPLAVPNTVLVGSGVGTGFRVAAADVVGSIGLGAGGASNSDYFSFAATAGELMNFEVMSQSLARLDGDSLDSILTVYEADGRTVVPYYNSPSGATDDDSFQSADPVLYDVVMPSSGTYYVKVSAYGATNAQGVALDSQIGGYELLLYSFATTPAGPTPAAPAVMGDTLVGGSGTDTLVGSSADDLIETAPGDAIVAGSGTNVVDPLPTGLAIAPSAITPGSPITFAGSFSGTTGLPYAYDWHVAASNGRVFPDATGTVAPIDGVASAPFQLQAGAAGVYAVTLTITDPLGGSAQATTSVTVGTPISVGINTVAATGSAGTPAPGQVVGTINTPIVLSAAASPTVTGYAWAVAGPGISPAAASSESSFSFTPTAAGTFTITLTASDSFGDAAVSTLQVLVLAPTIQIVGLPALGYEAEASPFTLTSLVGGPQGATRDETESWTVTDNSGATAPVTVAGSSVTYTPGDVGSYTVTLSLLDANKNVLASASEPIVAYGVAPTAALGFSGTAPGSVTEGATITLNASAASVSRSTASRGFYYTYTVSRNGYTWISPTTAATSPPPFAFAPGVAASNASTTSPTTAPVPFSFTPGVAGTYVITVTAVDTHGFLSAAATETIQVAPLAPTATVTGVPTAAVAQGSTVSLAALVTPPDAFLQGLTTSEVWTVQYGGLTIGRASGPNLTLVAGGLGVYTVTLTAADAEGLATTVTSTLSTYDVAPTIAAAASPAASPALQGTPDSYNLGTLTAPGLVNGPATVAVTWGDGTATTEVVTTQGALGTVAHAYQLAGTYKVGVTVTDAANRSGTSGFSTTVAAVAPAPTILGSPAASPSGSTISLGSSVTDPSMAETNLGFAYAWSVTDNGAAYGLPSGTVANASTFAFTPETGGTYVVSLTTTDASGTVGAPTAGSIAVNNVAPTATIAGLPAAPINGASPVVLAASATDPSTVDNAAGYSYAWTLTGPSTNITSASPGFSFTPRYVGTYTVALVATDSDKLTGTASGSFTVNDVPPTASLPAAAATATAGTAVALIASATDTNPADNSAGYTYAWTVAGPSLSLNSAGYVSSPAIGFTPEYAGVYLVTLTAKDALGTISSATTETVNVSYVVPTAAIAGAPASISAGSPINLTGSATDPSTAIGSKGYTYAWTVAGPSTSLTGTGPAFSFAPEYGGTYTVSLVATDTYSGLASVAATSAVKVNNVAPTAVIVGLPTSSSPSGTAISLTGSATDPSTAVAAAGYSYAWTVTGPNNTSLAGSAAAFSFTPEYGGTYTVTLAVTDRLNGLTGTTPKTVTVVNVPPTATLSGVPTSASPSGTAVSLSASATDASTADTAAGFTFAWSVTGPAGASFAGTTTSASPGFAFKPVAAGAYTVKLTASDTLGQSVVVSQGFSVKDLAPAVAGLVVASASSELATAASASFTDPDPTVTYTAAFNWGDGSTTAGKVVAPSGTTAGSIAGSHAYNNSGTYPVTLTLTDSAGFVETLTGQATVAQSIFLLDPTSSGSLALSGAATVNVGGPIFVDSRSATAVTANGSTKVTSAGLSVTGGVSTSGAASLGKYATGVTAVADPLASLPIPSAGATQTAVNLTYGSYTINPGDYSSINVNGSASLTMNPGVYIITGGGFAVGGSGAVTGSGVTIYNAGSSFPSNGGNFGGITLSGAGTVKLAAPTTGTYTGILVFQSRDNARAISITGSGAAGLSGTIYAPAATLSLSGAATESLPLVVADLNLSGSASSTETADGSESTSTTLGQLVAGDLYLAIDNSDGDLDPAEIGRIDDAVAGIDAFLAPYGVSITIVDGSDPTLTNLTLSMAATSAAGDASRGVLGSETDLDGGSKVITIVQGWSWYDGSDPSGIGAGQYDFESVVVHELGHALGLGHDPDPDSAMHASIDPDQVRRGLEVSDLGIPDHDGGAPSPLHAAEVPVGAGPIAPAGGDAEGPPVLDLVAPAAPSLAASAPAPKVAITPAVVAGPGRAASSKVRIAWAASQAEALLASTDPFGFDDLIADDPEGDARPAEAARPEILDAALDQVGPLAAGRALHPRMAGVGSAG